MKMTLLPAAFIILLAVACTNKDEKATHTEPATVNESESCYAYISGKDTVQLRISVHDNKVIGDLVYNFYEKDRNAGIITGEMKGDTLFGNYEFQSEGIASKRNVIFLKKANTFIEGYGALDPQTGIPDLSIKSAITFDSKIVLEKADCSSQEK